MPSQSGEPTRAIGLPPLQPEPATDGTVENVQQEPAVPATPPPAPPADDTATGLPDAGPAEPSRPELPAEVVTNTSPAGAAIEDYDDWRLECYEPSIEGVRCQILQQVVNRQASQPVLVMSLAYVPNRSHTEIQMAVPLGFLIGDGVTVTIGDYTTVLPVSRCINQGCRVDGVVASQLIQAMRDGSNGEVALKVADGQIFRVPFTLTGFQNAYDAMLARNR